MIVRRSGSLSGAFRVSRRPKAEDLSPLVIGQELKAPQLLHHGAQPEKMGNLERHFPCKLIPQLRKLATSESCLINVILDHRQDNHIQHNQPVLLALLIPQSMTFEDQDVRSR